MLIVYNVMSKVGGIFLKNRPFLHNFMNYKIDIKIKITHKILSNRYL